MSMDARTAQTDDFDQLQRLGHELVAREAAEARERGLREALEMCSFWVRVALDCGKWEWDWQQREAAEESHEAAVVALAAQPAAADGDAGEEETHS